MMVIGNIYVIASVAVVGGGLFGFDIASMSAQLTENSYKCYFNQGPNGPPFSYDNPEKGCSGPRSLVQGGITASMAAGSWLGALISGFVSDILGRKYAIMSGCVIWVVGSVIICASQNIGMLIVGRIINGIAVGIESAQVPVYISELSPPSKRGRFVGMQQWAITWGILIMYYISYGCAFIGGSDVDNWSAASWRVPWGLQMDRWEEAHEVLALVHGKGDRNHAFVTLELQDIREQCELERTFNDAGYLDLFKPRMLNRTMVGLFTQIWSQLTGMNVMMYYIGYVFGMAGYTGNATLLASSIQYIINVVMTLPALIWQDRWGRRPTMLVGALLMCIFMFANAGILGAHAEILAMDDRTSPEQSMSVKGAAAKGLIACTYLFVASYAPTWGPVSWTYPPELYPLRLRSKGVSLSTSGNWAFNTALGLFTPPAFENITWRTYVLFGVFNAAMFIHVFFMFPETAGKTLEETEAMFEDPNGPKYLGTPAWKTRVITNRTVALEHGDLETVKGREEVAPTVNMTEKTEAHA
ncbi:Hexose transporter [Penicillium waksmanii]|uniref:Hexose transporter n=1 Tax=Penicillium waksmanii TaxID=69791 RepID=UPI002546ADEF|nr:Hexose transporter [Penicillium waksmanii]KAJ5987741.1 Hexose transporter [Penicillium waksmanii]